MKRDYFKGEERDMLAEANDQFCWSCGNKLKPKIWYGNYDNATGKQYIGMTLHCPKNRWWKLGHSEYNFLAFYG